MRVHAGGAGGQVTGRPPLAGPSQAPCTASPGTAFATTGTPRAWRGAILSRGRSLALVSLNSSGQPAVGSLLARPQARRFPRGRRPPLGPAAPREEPSADVSAPGSGRPVVLQEPLRQVQLLQGLLHAPAGLGGRRASRAAAPGDRRPHEGSGGRNPGRGLRIGGERRP